ncbi:DHHA1 domain-containing protein [bacterium]|nr:DHHA1 domain-containing protein [bacterium]
MNITDISKMKNIIEQAECFVFTSHIDPDCDGLGGSLGLMLAFRQLGKKTYTILCDRFSSKYSWLPQSEEILYQFPSELPKNKKTVLFTVDAPNIPRLGFDQKVIDELDPIIVNLDHHTSNNRFGDLMVFDEKAASSTEVAYRLMQLLGLKLDPSIASLLYTGLITDTGRFRFSNTRSESFECAQHFLKAGAKHNLIIKKLFEEKPFEKLLLEQKVLSTLQNDKGIAWLKCTQEMMDEVNCSDSEEFVNKLTEVSGIEISLFFKEASPDSTKISLRARGDADVNQIASVFGGGGHAKAAGAKINLPLDEAIIKVVNECKKSLGHT